MSEKDQTNEPQFALQRVFVKNISFESPRAPSIFASEWKPEVKLDITAKHEKLKDNEYEVVISITATVSSSDKGKETAFIVEVDQAGLFFIKGLSEKDLDETLGAFCPNLLFPYAREAIDNMILRGNFPPLMLSPINFNALYEQAREKNKK